MRLLLDREGLAGEIAFLDGIGIDQERRQIEGVFADLAVAESRTCARSHGQKAVMVAAEIRIGLPLMSASELMSRRGWVISTCGSFWKIAITARSGTPCLHQVERR